MQQLPRLRRRAASEYLQSSWGISCRPATLAKLATIGGGPRFAHFGRWPVYDVKELDQWVLSRLSGLKSSTSDMGGSAPILAEATQ